MPNNFTYVTTWKGWKVTRSGQLYWAEKLGTGHNVCTRGAGRIIAAILLSEGRCYA